MRDGGYLPHQGYLIFHAKDQHVTNKKGDFETALSYSYFFIILWQQGGFEHKTHVL